MTFRPPGVTGTFRARAALSLALGAALLATSLPARAADDDVPIDRKIFGSILEGLGLRRDGEAINYQERPPLVIPPSRNLPPPETVDRALANNPAWPKDPDVVRRKREAQQERNRNISDEREREQKQRKEELAAQKPAGRAPEARPTTNPESRREPVITPPPGYGPGTEVTSDPVPEDSAPVHHARQNPYP